MNGNENANAPPPVSAGANAPAVEAEVHVDETVKRYNIHVSSKYLDLTKKKLELTRLPHDRPGVSGREEKDDVDVDTDAEHDGEGVVTKREIEGLVDHWLEDYTWRDRESYYNTTYPQYRSTFKVTPPILKASNPAIPPPSAQTVRIHFLHLRSSRNDAVPLLLIPSFPSSNLSLDLDVLTKELCNPEEGKQAFDVVIPSIPGTGFSDEIPGKNGSVVRETARLFDELMKRVGYADYVASMMGSGREKGGEVDYFLGREMALMGMEGGGACRGVHLIEPRWHAPNAKTQAWEWVRWKLALFFHAPVWGYEEGDWKILSLQKKKTGVSGIGGRISMGLGKKKKLRYGVVATVGLREPDTLAYALCDSPVGLLSFVATALRKKNPKHKMSKEKVIDLCQLCWLPGPEAALRYYANAAQENEHLKTEDGKGKAGRSRVAITVFDGEDESAGYSPPAWGMSRYDVVFKQRVTGSPGLLAWERLEVIFEGVRGLAMGVKNVDARIGVERASAHREEGLENREDGVNGNHDHGIQLDVESPDTIVAG